MNERQIKYMLTIFREGSISRAAEVLYVSQPSVSQMVRKVEEELRADLFVRHTNPLVLTPAGECYMQAARAIQSVQQNLDRQLEEIRLGTRGSIRLGMPLQRSLELLPDIFPRFHALSGRELKADGTGVRCTRNHALKPSAGHRLSHDQRKDQSAELYSREPRGTCAARLQEYGARGTRGGRHAD